MAEVKTYVPKASAKEITFQDGGSMMKISFHADTVAEFIRNHANEKGYINLCVTKRREPGKFGETHCVWLDTWKPTVQGAPGQYPPRATRNEVTQADLPPCAMKAGTPPPEEDDVPF